MIETAVKRPSVRAELASASPTIIWARWLLAPGIIGIVSDPVPFRVRGNPLDGHLARVAALINALIRAPAALSFIQSSHFDGVASQLDRDLHPYFVGRTSLLATQARNRKDHPVVDNDSDFVSIYGQVIPEAQMSTLLSESSTST